MSDSLIYSVTSIVIQLSSPSGEVQYLTRKGASKYWALTEWANMAWKFKDTHQGKHDVREVLDGTNCPAHSVISSNLVNHLTVKALKVQNEINILNELEVL